MSRAEHRIDPHILELRTILDSYGGRYQELRKAREFEAYLAAGCDQADEELLTEPILAQIIERVLGFPVDGYFPQLGKSGLKPDFTPIDLIAHRFVLDAKASNEALGGHEIQIRRYVDQRVLDYGVLFNLRELRVYRRGARGHDPGLSFTLLPLWQLARGEILAAPDEERAFARFCETFAHRTMGVDQKIAHVRSQEPWHTRIAMGEPVSVDIEFLVSRLHSLSEQLAEDADSQVDELFRALGFDQNRRRKLLEELRVVALDLAPGADPTELPTSVDDWRSTAGLPQRVWRQYLLRVAYLALVRVLLHRSWEDSGFVDDLLSDGGFGDAYDRLAQSLAEVLEAAFQQGARRYRWLYGSDNNYDWYRPRDEALIDVLYSLAAVPLGRLDADVLGALYQSYVEEIDRDRLGQFFTPRSVVKFMLDRAGYSGADGIFKLSGDERHPRSLFDFATGSGGFLVEAARRVIDDSGIDHTDPRDLDDALRSIVDGLVGTEISPFPYYLTEVNLLLQASRVLGEMASEGIRPPSFVLGVLHADTLATKSTPSASLAVAAALRGDRAELETDERYDLMPLDDAKQSRYLDLRRDGGFDLVVGNPPYVTEANNKPLFDRLGQIHAWDEIYRGKTDYLYYFLWLAVDKLAPGGRLAVIVPAGWMNAGAAGFLREVLAEELTLDELFLFGSYKVFAPEHGSAPTPTVESAILIATKGPAPRGHKLRVVALEDEARAGNPERESLLGEMARRAAGRQGRRGGIHVHDLRQSHLRADRPWPVKHGAKDTATLVVRHLDVMLSQDDSVEPLATSWKVFQGIQTGADAYSNRVAKRLSAAERARLEATGARIGAPILELPPGAERTPPWSQHPGLLARSPESRALLYGAIDEADFASLVWIDRGTTVPPEIEAELAPWRTVLANRAEILRNPGRRWLECAWPRARDDMLAPKVIALYRTDRGRFALDETGEWQPSIKATLAVGRAQNAPVAYLCGLLNSELIDLWYAVRGKTPWHVRRNYEPQRMNEIPYRRPDGDPRADLVADLVRKIAANRSALLPYRDVAPELTRMVKDPWKTGPFTIAPATVIRDLDADTAVSVRLDPELERALGQGPLGRASRTEDALVFTYKRKQTGYIKGPSGRLDLLLALLPETDDPTSVILPRDMSWFAALVDRRRGEIAALLDEGRELVEQVERVVCSLYGLPDDLADAVVEHALQRAGSGPQDAQSDHA